MPLPETLAVDQAVIPLAGRGTRLLPATRVLPKGLLPLPGRDGKLRPLVQLLIDEMSVSGIRRVILVTTDGHRSFFEAAVDAPTGTEVLTTVQTAPRGLGDAVSCARSLLEPGRFVVALGDHVYRSDSERCSVGQLLDVARAHAGAWTAVTRVTDDELVGTAALVGDPIAGRPDQYRLRRLREKPSPEIARRELRQLGLPPDQYLGHFGLHVFPASLFDALAELTEETPTDREIELTEAQSRLLERGETYSLLEIVGTRLDTGVPSAFLEAWIALAADSSLAPALREAVARWLDQPPPPTLR